MERVQARSVGHNPLGEHERDRQLVHNMVTKGLMLAQIADLLSLSLDKVQALLNEEVGG